MSEVPLNGLGFRVQGPGFRRLRSTTGGEECCGGTHLPARRVRTRPKARASESLMGGTPSMATPPLRRAASSALPSCSSGQEGHALDFIVLRPGATTSDRSTIRVG